MLVLSRRVGEEIVIDGSIRVAVLGVKGQRIRLGITAPTSIRVLRQEQFAASAESCDGSVGRGLDDAGDN